MTTGGAAALFLSTPGIGHITTRRADPDVALRAAMWSILSREGRK